MVTIDHTAYPYLIDLIIEYAPPEALKQLSSTSRAFRARLLSHAALTLAPGARYCTFQIKSRHKSHTERKGWATTETPDDRLSPYPPLVLAAPGSGGALPLVPGAVRTLDHVTPHRPRPALADAFTSVHTLRRMNGAYALIGPTIFYPTPTVVDFVRVDRAAARRAQNREIDTVVPLGASSYILHIDLRPWAAESKRRADLAVVVNNDFASAGNLVFVLWLADGAEADVPALYAAIGSAVRNWPAEGAGRSITVVGLERAADAPTLDELWDEFGTYVARRRSNMKPARWGKGAFEEQLREGLRLLTVEEWWAELGDRREVEGVWPKSAEDGPQDV
ncbi:hypothetical protein Q8F55_000061 [Vanrija albida]|uniref:F-box domain-containing protein n=1 Tax=Vanrija albida TaxID=181172 RepID=A0ABR3QCC5_9TREE